MAGGNHLSRTLFFSGYLTKQNGRKSGLIHSTPLALAYFDSHLDSKSLEFPQKSPDHLAINTLGFPAQTRQETHNRKRSEVVWHRTRLPVAFTDANDRSQGCHLSTFVAWLYGGHFSFGIPPIKPYHCSAHTSCVRVPE